MQLQLSSSYQNKDKAVAWTNKIIGNKGLSVSLHNSWHLFFTLSLHVSFGSGLGSHNSWLVCFTLSYINLLVLRIYVLFWLQADKCSYTTVSWFALLSPLYISLGSGLTCLVRTLILVTSRRVFLPTLSPWFHHQIAQQVQSLHTWLPFGSWQDDVRTWFNSLHQKHNEINFAGLGDYHITILSARQLGSYISLYCSS